jgi:DNA (cytosine-5)-methyltransferase 1
MHQLSMFSVGELHASPSLSQDSEAEWLMSVVTSPLPFASFLLENSPAGFYGRMSPESLALSQMKQTSADGADGGSGSEGQPFVETADFATLLTAFQECGYSCAWRILDAQHFGVPQRRRRVFVVGHLGSDWRPPFAVLFERNSLRRDLTPSRAEGQTVAAAIGTRPYADRGEGNTASNIVSSFWDGSQTSQTLDAVLHKGQTMPEKNRFPAVLQSKTIDCRNDATNEEISGTIQSKNNRGHSLNYINPVIYDKGQITNKDHKSKHTPELSPTLHSNTRDMIVGMPDPDAEKPVLWSVMPENSSKDYKAKIVQKAQTLKAQQGTDIVQHPTIIRRLTPLECERLQGFPDNFTNIPGASDSNRYEAIGNSMAIPVMQWLGKRIGMVDRILKNLSQ